MAYGGGVPAFRPLAESGVRLKLSDLTRGRPLRPNSRFQGRITWTSRGRRVAEVGYDLTTADVSGSVRLLYTATLRGGEPLPMDYVIGLTVTEQPGAGVRWWFWCERGRTICHVLRMMPGSAVFASAAAFGRIAYRSQRVCDRDRHLEKAQAIRASLGGSVCVWEPFPPRPPRMWNRTYERLRATAEAAGNTSLAFLSRELDRFGPAVSATLARRGGGGEMTRLEPGSAGRSASALVARRRDGLKT